MNDINPDLTIILPCIHEADNFSVLSDKLHKAVSEITMPCTCLFVGPPDGEQQMRDVVEKAGFRYVSRQPTGSYGDAVRTGITEAATKYIAFMDADNSHDPNFIVAAQELLENNVDLVVGSRYMDGGNTENGLVSRLMSHTVNTIFRLILGTKISDLSNSQKIYRRALINKNLSCNNFDIIEEMVWNVIKYGDKLNIHEIPATFNKRLHGETKRDFIPFVKSYVFTALRLLSFRLNFRQYPN
jgi:dolichol-phosphate mannosyltransferase